MTQKSEIEIEEEIMMIRDGCNECWLSKGCIISHVVDYIIEHSEKDYEKMKTVISFCGDWCPHVESDIMSNRCDE